jgi:hypothetical protein
MFEPRVDGLHSATSAVNASFFEVRQVDVAVLRGGSSLQVPWPQVLALVLALMVPLERRLGRMRHRFTGHIGSDVS